MPPLLTVPAAPPPDEPTVAWDLARVLLLGAAAALLVAAWFALRPVDNPGVQDCGPPLRYIVESTDDALVPIGVPGAPEDAPELRAQEPCSQRVVRELERAGLFTIACVGLGLLGAALGLLDDRIQLRRAPRFEQLVRERPADAPGRAFDPVVTTVDELVEDLPPVEPAELVLLGVGGAVGLVGVAVLVDGGATVDALAELGLGAAMALVALAALTRAVAGVVRWLTLDPPSPLTAPDDEADRAVAMAAGGPGSVATARAEAPPGAAVVGWMASTVASGWSARVRPETGVFGIDVHHLCRARVTDRSVAVGRVGLLATAALVVHLAVLVLVAVGGAPDVPEPDARAYLLLVGAVAIGTLLGLARVPRVLRAQAVLPSTAGLTAAVGPGGRARAAVAVGGAAAQIGLEVLTLALALAAVGGSLDLRAVALAWLAALTIGAASPFPSGVGLTEAVLALLLWRWGVEPGAAVAAVVVFRCVTVWLPLAPGAVAARRVERQAGG